MRDGDVASLHAPPRKYYPRRPRRAVRLRYMLWLPKDGLLIVDLSYTCGSHLPSQLQYVKFKRGLLMAGRVTRRGMEHHLDFEAQQGTARSF